MSDLLHHLEFSVTGKDWKSVEREAAQVIRGYTSAPRTGRNATADEAVLRDAEFFCTRGEDDDLPWSVVVKVTV